MSKKIEDGATPESSRQRMMLNDSNVSPTTATDTLAASTTDAVVVGAAVWPLPLSRLLLGQRREELISSFVSDVCKPFYIEEEL